MRVAVLGLGATGSHVARQLGASEVDELLLYDTDASRTEAVLRSMVGTAAKRGPADGADADVVVLASPTGQHADSARRALANGSNVVSISDAMDDVRHLLALSGEATTADRTILAGAGFAPGLTCLLARHAANTLDEVIEIAVAKSGTAGPACARQHHQAMREDAVDWVDGAWINRPGGSGRDLAWFPPPIGARDCYKAALPSPLLLQRCFPEANRIAARVTATRRDRLTSRLPMLRPPHADGGPGAARVEVRGRRDGVFETVVYAVTHHPSVAAGIVAATAALAIARPSSEPVVMHPGAYGLAEIADPLPILRELHDRGLRTATFEGSVWAG